MKDNLCTKFLLPLLGLPKEFIRENTDKGDRRIINAFLYDDEVLGYREGHLFLLYRSYQDTRFQNWEDKLIGQEHCVDSYNLLDSKYAVTIHNMGMYDDYTKFMEGKYSEYSDWGKNRCTEFAVDSGLVVKQVIEKSPDLLKIMAAKFNMKEEDFGDAELAPLWDHAEITNVLNQQTKDFLRSKSRLKIETLRLNP
jgi:hypothetical protein